MASNWCIQGYTYLPTDKHTKAINPTFTGILQNKNIHNSNYINITEMFKINYLKSLE